MPEIMEQAKDQANKFKTGFDVVSDPDGMEIAFKDADIVYAKSWGPLLTTNDPDDDPLPPEDHLEEILYGRFLARCLVAFDHIRTSGPASSSSRSRA